MRGAHIDMPPPESRTSSLRGPVTKHLVDEILTKKARKYGVVVWYDPAGSFKELVDGLSIERVRVIPLRGSYYRLRYDAEEVFGRLDRNSIAGEEGLIVYVDSAPLEKHSDVLLGLEKSGIRFDWSLAAVARDALKDQVSRDVLDSWLSNDKLRLEDVDRLTGGDVLGEMSAVALVFETTVAADVAIRYLVEPALIVEVDNRGALEGLGTLLSGALGVPIEGITSQESLRKRVGRHVLMTEFISSMNPGTTPSELAAFPVAKTSAQVEACCRVARGMRDRWRSREDYMALAESVQIECSLRSLKIDPGTLGNLDTFPFAEEILLRSLGDMAKRGQVDTALDRVKEREGSFWSVVDPVRAMQWQTAQTALALCREAMRVVEEVKQCKRSPEVFARNYAQGEEGRGRWCVMDSLERRLEWLVATADVDFAVEDLIGLSRNRYQSAASVLTERFLQAIRSEGFAFGGISQQADTFTRFVRPAMEKGPVAYFLVSGMRYEMAGELLGSLSFAERSELHPAIAVPPPLPAIGMSALLPGAEAGLSLREKAGHLLVEVDGAIFADSTDRVRFLKRRLGEDTVVDLSLADLLTKRGDVLRKRVEGKKLIVVRSPDVEGLSTEASTLQARKLMGDLLTDVRRGIRRMSDAGVSQVVVASSHGFLLSWNLEEPSVEPPDGRPTDLGARSWIGRGGGDRPEYVRFRSSELGLGGELDVAVPFKLELFKTGREPVPYVSGGLSPQELIVPVAVITVPASSAAAAEDQFDLVLGRERITNRLFTVAVRYHKGSLLSTEDRRVRVVARSGKDEIGRSATAIHGFDQVTGEVVLVAGREEHVTIMMTNEVRRGSLVVAIIDSDTEATLKQTGDVPFDLPI